jgi:hypothetical protein
MAKIISEVRMTDGRIYKVGEAEMISEINPIFADGKTVPFKYEVITMVLIEDRTTPKYVLMAELFQPHVTCVRYDLIEAAKG